MSRTREGILTLALALFIAQVLAWAGVGAALYGDMKAGETPVAYQWWSLVNALLIALGILAALGALAVSALRDIFSRESQ